MMCVLLVEDEAIILMDVAETLESAGHEVLAFNAGHQALAAIERWKGRFSALVTDHQLPGGIFGSEIATAMRAAYPDIPIIIATGNATDIPEDFRSHYRITVLPKPYVATALVRALPPPRRPTV